LPQGRWEEMMADKTCGLDIDGVLNYYPQPWLDFLNGWLDTEFTDLNHAKKIVPYQTYRDIKWEYRESGVKAELTVRDGAKELTYKLKEKGYTILVLTSRPFDSHKGLFKQTIDWLHQSDLQYDGIIFGSNKLQEVLHKAPNLSFLIEDHRFYANMVAKWGYPVFLMDNQYNQGTLLPEVTRIKHLWEVFQYGV
jgi:uncharacterized HAD superfamily protein